MSELELEPREPTLVERARIEKQQVEDLVREVSERHGYNNDKVARLLEEAAKVVRERQAAAAAVNSEPANQERRFRPLDSNQDE